MSKKELTNVLSNVKEQYEELPYPARDPKDEKARVLMTLGAFAPKINQHCFNAKQDFNNFRVLVAGGGTGDAAIAWAEQLLEKENSEVIYVDMSSKSMSIAQERAKIRKLNNITWINDSLLNVKELNIGEFDFIDCSGVLHHLADPDAGLKALKSVLKPEGSMAIMVYAKYGRSAIYIIQELMRIVNGDEQDPHAKIENAKKILESNPSYNLFNILQGLKLWNYNDIKSDAGIYDLFLHSQDRAYTILEVHDWLERCGLKMIGEPGARYEAKQYLPETYIKDKNLLEQIKQKPLKIQHAIAEAMSTNISKHSFFCTHEERENTEASIYDDDMVLSKGLLRIDDFNELANIALQQRETVTITYNNAPMKPDIEIPHGKYIPSLLKQIDGERTVKEVIEAVKNSPKWKDKKIDEKLIMEELEILLKSFNRAGIMYLRHKSVPDYRSLTEYAIRVSKMYKK